jgi:hypothetical protein
MPKSRARVFSSRASCTIKARPGEGGADREDSREPGTGWSETRLQSWEVRFPPPCPALRFCHTTHLPSADLPWVGRPPLWPSPQPPPSQSLKNPLPGGMGEAGTYHERMVSRGRQNKLMPPLEASHKQSPQTRYCTCLKCSKVSLTHMVGCCEAHLSGLILTSPAYFTPNS